MDFLCNHYNDMTWGEIANELGRTRKGVYSKGHDLGIVQKKTKLESYLVYQCPIYEEG